MGRGFESQPITALAPPNVTILRFRYYKVQQTQTAKGKQANEVNCDRTIFIILSGREVFQHQPIRVLEVSKDILFKDHASHLFFMPKNE